MNVKMIDQQWGIHRCYSLADAPLPSGCHRHILRARSITGPMDSAATTSNTTRSRYVINACTKEWLSATKYHPNGRAPTRAKGIRYHQRAEPRRLHRPVLANHTSATTRGGTSIFTCQRWTSSPTFFLRAAVRVILRVPDVPPDLYTTLENPSRTKSTPVTKDERIHFVSMSPPYPMAHDKETASANKIVFTTWSRPIPSRARNTCIPKGRPNATIGVSRKSKKTVTPPITK